MGHPIIDGLLAGAAVGVGASLANQMLQPGQTPVWTGTINGVLITVVQNRNGPYTMFAICYGCAVPLGVYPNWAQLLAGLQVWTDYLNRGGTIEAWLKHSLEVYEQQQQELKRPGDQHHQQVE